MITKKDRLATGVVDYFRNALAAIGRLSTFSNTKYPPAEPTKDGSPRWNFDVSTEHADAILSHLSQRGEIDPETGASHTVALAWRALALLETELVAGGAAPGLAVVRAEIVRKPMSPPEFECPRDPYAGLTGGPDAETPLPTDEQLRFLHG